MRYYKVIPTEVSHLEELKKTIQLFYNEVIGNIDAKYIIKLQRSIKQTDFLVFKNLPFGYVVSPKLKDILKNHKLPASQFYPIPVLIGKKITTYYWVHWLFDFNKSFIEMKSKKNPSNYKTFTFKNNFKGYDIINIHNTEEEVYFSEKLVKNLKKSNITSIISTQYVYIDG